MVPGNAVDIARIRKLLDVAEDHLDETEVFIYFSSDGNYVSMELKIRNAPEARDVMRLQPEALLIGSE